MKKLFTVLAITASSTVHAQEWQHRFSENVFHTSSILAVFILIVFFVLNFLQRILDHRLKNKIVDKGISETLSSSLLNNNPKESMHGTIKWFCLLASTGIGMLIVYYTMPLHIHSLAIMAFSIAVGFLGYYFFLKKSDH